MISSGSYYSYLTGRSALSLWARRPFMGDFVRHFAGSVVDAGCGMGEFLNRYPCSVGLDHNPYLVEHCVRQGFACCAGDAFDLPFPARSFDGVLASNLLEHIADARRAVQEAARVLKSGGVLVVSVPMEAGFRHEPTHVRMFHESDLQALARRAGLRTKTIYRYPFRWRWPGRYLYFCELRAVFVK